jgi:hypothetical protein
MLIPNCGTRQGERRGEEMRDTDLRKGNKTPLCFHQYSYLFRYTHLSLDMENNWCEHGEIAVPDRPDYRVLNFLATRSVEVFALCLGE